MYISSTNKTFFVLLNSPVELSQTTAIARPSCSQGFLSLGPPPSPKAGGWAGNDREPYDSSEKWSQFHLESALLPETIVIIPETSIFD